MGHGRDRETPETDNLILVIAKNARPTFEGRVDHCLIDAHSRGEFWGAGGMTVCEQIP